MSRRSGKCTWRFCGFKITRQISICGHLERQSWTTAAGSVNRSNTWKHNRTVGGLAGWRFDRFKDWRVDRMAGWRFAVWRVGRLAGSHVGRLASWPVSALAGYLWASSESVHGAFAGRIGRNIPRQTSKSPSWAAKLNWLSRQTRQAWPENTIEN